MKFISKATIAKLLVVCLIVSMMGVPVSAIDTTSGTTGSSGDITYSVETDVNGNVTAYKVTGDATIKSDTPFGDGTTLKVDGDVTIDSTANIPENFTIEANGDVEATGTKIAGQLTAIVVAGKTVTMSNVTLDNAAATLTVKVGETELYTASKQVSIKTLTVTPPAARSIATYAAAVTDVIAGEVTLNEENASFKYLTANGTGVTVNVADGKGLTTNEDTTTAEGYTIVTAVKETGSEATSCVLDPTTFSTAGDKEVVTNDELASKGLNPPFSVDGEVQKRMSTNNPGQVYAFDTKGRGSGALVITIPDGKTATIEAKVASTGGSNTSDFALQKDGQTIANKEGKTTVTGGTSDAITVTYENLDGGEYKLFTPADAENNRGLRIVLVTVTINGAGSGPEGPEGPEGPSGSDANKPYVLTIDVKPVSTAGTVSVTVDDVAVTLKDNAYDVKPDAKVVITATPGDGYVDSSISGVTAEKGTAGNSQTYTFKMPKSATTAVVTFTEDTSTSTGEEHTVTVAETKNGTVAVDKTKAKKDEVVTITTTPDSKYKVGSVSVTYTVGDDTGTVDVVTVSTNSSYTFEMPDYDATVTVTFSKKSSGGGSGGGGGSATKPNEPTTPGTPGTPAPTSPFRDVSTDAYYYEAVLWAIEKGITVGMTADTFGPDVSCTRAQMLTMLWRLAGSPKAEGENPFTDVSVDDYYYDAVQWAVKNGITLGTTETTFSPDATVNRAQSVTFLYRYAGQPTASGSSFADVSAEDYYANATAWAAQNGIALGYGNGNFGPSDDCVRAQIVTFMYRYAG